MTITVNYTKLLFGAHKYHHHDNSLSSPRPFECATERPVCCVFTNDINENNCSQVRDGGGLAKDTEGGGEREREGVGSNYYELAIKVLSFMITYFKPS